MLNIVEPPVTKLKIYYSHIQTKITRKIEISNSTILEIPFTDQNTRFQIKDQLQKREPLIIVHRHNVTDHIIQKDSFVEVHLKSNPNQPIIGRCTSIVENFGSKTTTYIILGKNNQKTSIMKDDIQSFTLVDESAELNKLNLNDSNEYSSFTHISSSAYTPPSSSSSSSFLPSEIISILKESSVYISIYGEGTRVITVSYYTDKFSFNNIYETSSKFDNIFDFPNKSNQIYDFKLSAFVKWDNGLKINLKDVETKFINVDSKTGKETLVLKCNISVGANQSVKIPNGQFECKAKKTYMYTKDSGHRGIVFINQSERTIFKGYVNIGKIYDKRVCFDTEPNQNCYISCKDVPVESFASIICQYTQSTEVMIPTIYKLPNDQQQVIAKCISLFNSSYTFTNTDNHIKSKEEKIIVVYDESLYEELISDAVIAPGYFTTTLQHDDVFKSIDITGERNRWSTVNIESQKDIFDKFGESDRLDLDRDEQDRFIRVAFPFDQPKHISKVLGLPFGHLPNNNITFGKSQTGLFNQNTTFGQPSGSIFGSTKLFTRNEATFPKLTPTIDGTTVINSISAQNENQNKSYEQLRLEDQANQTTSLSFGTSTSQSTGVFGSTSNQQSTTGGLSFGSPAQPSSTGVFGSTSNQQSTTGGFSFGSTSNQQPTTGGFSFGLGSTSDSLPAQPSGGSLFGTSSVQPSGGSLFGTASAQPSGGSPFGTSSVQPSGGSLFGTSSAQPSGGSLFGTSSVQPSAGLFGTSPAPPSGGSPFGTSPAPPSGGSLFGTSPAPPSAGLFGTASAHPSSTESPFGTSAPPSGGLFGTSSSTENPFGTSSSTENPFRTSPGQPSGGSPFGTSSAHPSSSTSSQPSSK